MEQTITIANGVKIPKIMMGTYDIFGDEAKKVFKAAYDIGYRAIDSGRYYRNERDWGEAIKASGARREDIFIQTKVSHAEEKKGLDVIKDFEITLSNFSTDYIDCLLIHWPNMKTFEATWKAMEKLYKDGKVRVIGVSNFRREHFEILRNTAEVFPMINQIERHPCRHQPETYGYCRANGVQLQAYQPLAAGRPELLNNELLIAIAKKHGYTVAQVAIAWNIKTGVIPLPRTRNAIRLRENFEALHVKLTNDEIEMINNDRMHYFRALKESSEYPGYWDVIHRVDAEKYL